MVDSYPVMILGIGLGAMSFCFGMSVARNQRSSNKELSSVLFSQGLGCLFFWGMFLWKTSVWLRAGQ